MKHILTTISAFLLGTAALIGQANLPNGIAAQVDGHIITMEDLRRELAPLIPQIRASVGTRSEYDQRLTEVAQEILRTLIDRALIIEEFDREGYQIPQLFLNNAYDDYITNEFAGDRAQFLQYLRSIGKSDLEFRDELRERIIVDYMRGQQMDDAMSVSPERVREYYDLHQNRFFEEEGVELNMMTLKPTALESEAQLLEKAEALVQELRNGADFALLARQHSTDERADDGGSWGWVKRDLLREELANVAFAMAPGQISDPLVLGSSVYILEVTDKREAGIKDLDAVRGEIEQAIATQLARQATERWLEGLRSRAYIQVHLNDIPNVFGGKQDDSVEMSFGSES